MELQPNNSQATGHGKQVCVKALLVKCTAQQLSISPPALLTSLPIMRGTSSFTPGHVSVLHYLYESAAPNPSVTKYPHVKYIQHPKAAHWVPSKQSEKGKKT